jgi:hypothetical protein
MATVAQMTDLVESSQIIYGVYYTFWDDYSLVKLFSTKEKAQAYITSPERKDDRGQDIRERFSIDQLEVK